MRARRAVAVLFFVNGALISTVLPRLPAIKADLGLSNSALGAAVAASAFGALATGTLSGTVTARLGSARLSVLTGVVYGGAIALVGVAGGWAALAAAFVLIGVLDVLMDVSMNAHGLRVQRGYDRSIFNAFHAWWSIGATFGGAAGAGAAAIDAPILAHLLLVGLLLAAATAASGRWLLRGPDPADVTPEDAAGPAVAPPRGLRLVRALAPFALLSVVGAVVEDVPGSFGAVYLRDALGASPGVAGLGYVGFVAGMTAGRFVADRLVDRLGTSTVVRSGNVLAAVGLGAALLVDHPVAAVVGFTAVGVGASATIPSLFVAAGRSADSTADGVALVSWATRAGFLASPVIVGTVADAAGLPVGVALCVVAATVVAIAWRGAPAQR